MTRSCRPGALAAARAPALSLALLAMASLGGCAAADSVSLGDYDPIDADSASAGDEVEPAGSEVPLAPGVTPRENLFDFALGAVDQNAGSALGSSFPGPENRAEGGDFWGTWIVEKTLNPVRDSQVLLQRWGEQAMDLDTDSCLGAVNKLEVVWSGTLSLDPDQAWAYDTRKETRVADIEIDRECLGETLGVGAPVNTSHTNCAALERSDVDNDESLHVNCTSNGDHCECVGRRVVPRDSGPVAQSGATKMLIGNRFFDYTVLDDRLYLREQSSNRMVLLRRNTAPPLPSLIDREPILIGDPR